MIEIVEDFLKLPNFVIHTNSGLEGVVGLAQAENEDECIARCKETGGCAGYVYDYIKWPGVCVLKSKVCPGQKSEGFYEKMTSGIFIERAAGKRFILVFQNVYCSYSKI